MADGEITDGTLDTGGLADIVRATTRPETPVTTSTVPVEASDA
jgi:hypothetical protein